MERNELYDWLRKTFIKDNHKKYHVFFDEWYYNLTENQIYYFNEQRLHILNNWLSIK